MKLLTFKFFKILKYHHKEVYTEYHHSATMLKNGKWHFFAPFVQFRTGSPQTETGEGGANKYEKTKQKNSSLKQFFYLLKRGSRPGVFLLQEFYESFKATYFAKHL